MEFSAAELGEDMRRSRFKKEEHELSFEHVKFQIHVMYPREEVECVLDKK